MVNIFGITIVLQEMQIDVLQVLVHQETEMVERDVLSSAVLSQDASVQNVQIQPAVQTERALRLRRRKRCAEQSSLSR